MLVSILNLRDCLFQRPSRASELIALRRNLTRQLRGSSFSAEELRLALELRTLRLALFAALPRSSVCRSCAEHFPPPHGTWPGGYCCGAPTQDLFTDDEIASLHAAGTRPQDLQPPQGEHAGCVFRGPAGCSLSPAHRPNICVRHICWDLARALQAYGVLTQVEDLGQQIKNRFERFVRIRHDRLEEEFFNGLDKSGPENFFKNMCARMRQYVWDGSGVIPR